jgi:hypothetical protein
MHSRLHLIAAFLTVRLIVAWMAFASSPIVEHLAGVESVNVKAIVLSPDSVLGSSRKKIGDDIELLTEDILEKNDIAVVCSSDQDIRIYLLYEDDAVPDAQAATGKIALSVRLELREQAKIPRRRSSSQESMIRVTSWRESMLILAAPENAYDQLFEAVEILATSFAEETRAARLHASRRD